MHLWRSLEILWTIKNHLKLKRRESFGSPLFGQKMPCLGSRPISLNGHPVFDCSDGIWFSLNSGSSKELGSSTSIGISTSWNYRNYAKFGQILKLQYFELVWKQTEREKQRKKNAKKWNEISYFSRFFSILLLI